MAFEHWSTCTCCGVSAPGVTERGGKLLCEACSPREARSKPEGKRKAPRR